MLTKLNSFGTPTRNGFTLLEIILALSLTVMIVAAIASAMRINVVILDRQRTKIEQSQVARSVLQVFARDLRAAVQHKPADVAGLQEMMSSPADLSALMGGGLDPSALDPSALGDLAGGLPAGGLPAGGQAGGGQAGGIGGMGQPETEQESFDSGTINDCVSQPCHPGLYGDETQLSVDISRLPRIDEYTTQDVGGGVQSIPSDIKTVAYYVEQNDQENTISYDLNSDKNMGGLYRRYSDRAVASYSYDAGAELSSVANRELIAPEIAEIRFRYFDGEDWVTSWDSEQAGGFPTAVEVIVVIDPRRVAMETQSANYQYNGYDSQTMTQYRSVVYLPVAEILSDEEIELIEAGNSMTESSEEEAAGEDGAAR